MWPQSCFDWQLKLGPVEFCQLSLLQKSEWEALLQFRLPGLTLHFNILSEENVNEILFFFVFETKHVK